MYGFAIRFCPCRPRNMSHAWCSSGPFATHNSRKNSKKSGTFVYIPAVKWNADRSVIGCEIPNRGLTDVDHVASTVFMSTCLISHRNCGDCSIDTL